MSLLTELKRRNVIRVGTAYVVASWLLIQVAETVLGAFGLGDEAIRVLVIVLGVGFVPVVIGAWIFEITPDGLKLDSEADQSAPASVQARKRLDRAILLILVLAVGYFSLDKFLLDPRRDEAREQEVAERARSEAVVGFYGNRSIAVLPFVNMSSDPEQAFFAEGISEEVLNLLAKIRELRVISRSSAFAFKEQNIEIREIAERLNVAHVLEGSVRKSGNKIRVTAQLIEARTDTHLWSETYDRPLDDIFAIQDEIAADVAENLRIEILRPLPKSRRTDPEVLALTMQAKQIAETRPEGRGRKMHSLLDRALSIDPDYVPALEWMITAQYFREEEGDITQEEEDEEFEKVVARILALEPDNATVPAMRAWGTAFEAFDLEKAARLYEESLSKDISNSNAVRLAGAFARHIGHLEISVRLLEHATAIDPLCFQCLYQLSRAYMYAGQLDQAEAARKRYMAIGNGGNVHYGLIKLLQGDPDAALRIYNEFPAGQEQGIAGRAMAYFDLGRIEDADAALAELSAVQGMQLDALVAEANAWMNRKDQAFASLRAYADRDIDAARRDVFSPAYRNLHGDPRWDAWRESIGMSEERLAAIEFDPDLPE